MLCRLLTATGKSGLPDSHFHSPSISDWMGYYDIAADSNKSERTLLSDIFQAARNRGTGNTGIFGLRLQGQSFEYFLQKLRLLSPGSLTDHERIQAVFGRTLFVHLTRNNKLEQAISYVIASQTGLWHKAPNRQELERLSALQEPVYDAMAIQQHMTEFAVMDERWITWFSSECITPQHINYEDLSEDPISITGELLQRLGLDDELTIGLEIPVVKLADTVNSQWALRFRSDNSF